MNLHKGRWLINTFIIAVFISFLLYAKSNGKVGKTLKDDDGCDCHGDQSKKVSVVISGPSELKPSQTADYTVTITGGPLVNAGVNIAASSGVLVPGASLKLSKGELTHNDPKKPENGKVVFNFKLQAPANAGAVTLYASANSSNGDEGKKGDLWNHANNFAIKIAAK